MDFFVSVLIFVVILILYIHIMAHYKRSEELEIYEMDFIKNSHLQEVCDIKQPFLFKYNSVNPEFFEKLNDETIYDLVASQDVRVKEIGDYWNPNEKTVDSVVVPLSSFQMLISTDTKSRYFTENNYDLIEDDTKLDRLFRKNDHYLKPILTMKTKYDICMGSKGVIKPMRYHTNYRHYICVNSGKITVKMTPFKSNKYLHPIKNYDTYEFRSPVNVWNPPEMYMNDVESMRVVEVNVVAGNILYVPPYWWYSIKFDNTDTLISEFTYISLMNSVANSLDWVRNFIQNSNIEKNLSKSIGISKTNLANTNEDE